jgi:hypothetical protein
MLDSVIQTMRQSGRYYNLWENSVVLVLVNRILDRDKTSGLDLIKELVAEREKREDANPAHIMLVSNYPEFQREAVQMGAVEGFGKDMLGAESTRNLLATLIDQ